MASYTIVETKVTLKNQKRSVGFQNIKNTANSVELYNFGDSVRKLMDEDTKDVYKILLTKKYKIYE